MAMSTGGRSIIKPTRVNVGKDIYISKKQHDELLKFALERLDFGKQHRDIQAQRFATIDREIAGDLQLEREDKKRKADNKKGKSVKTYDTSLPLTLKQIEDSTTNLLSILADEEGMYSAIASADKQKAANALTAIMNQHANMFGHFRQLNISLNHMLRYNFGGNIVEWEQVLGNKIRNGTNGMSMEVERTAIVRQGNSLNAIDPYNFLYDWTVPASDLHFNGEFFALVDAVMPFRLKKMKRAGQLFGDIDKYLEGHTSGFAARYYYARPSLHLDEATFSADFISIFSMGMGKTIGAAAELIDLYVWMEPKGFGLSTSDEYEIWRLKILNGELIVDCTMLNNAHGMLPCAIGTPQEDMFKQDTKSYGELLLPFQRFASAQMNIHQRSARKKLYGMTFYNERIFPAFADYKDEDLYAARIPFAPTQENENFDINKHVKTMYDAPDTSSTTGDIRAMMEMMNHILPTDQLRQVADLDRATQYQAAATVQGSNRGNWRLAKLIDTQHFTPLRFMQYYNVLQYQQSIELLDPQSKERVEIDPSILRETRLEFAVSEGIKSLDKMIYTNNLKEVIRWMLQSADAQKRYDVISIINQWTSLQGDKTDFTQFEFKSPLDAMSPEEKQQVLAIYQQYIAAQQAGGTQQ